MIHTRVTRKLKNGCFHLRQMGWNCAPTWACFIKVQGESQKSDNFQNFKTSQFPVNHPVLISWQTNGDLVFLMLFSGNCKFIIWEWTNMWLSPTCQKFWAFMQKDLRTNFVGVTSFLVLYGVKAIPLLAWAGPKDSSSLRLAYFNRHMKVVNCQPYPPAAFTPRNITGTNFC